MRRLAGLLLFVVVLATGAVIGVLGRSWLDTQRGQTGMSPQAAAPVAIATSPPAPQSVAPGTRDMVLEVSESELQAQMSTMLVGRSLGSTPLGDTTIQSVTVALRDRQVHVGGTAKTGFVQAPFTAVGTVAPDPAGRPRVRISEASVGGVLLPDSARAALTDTLQTQVDRLFADRAMKVRTIDIADGKMTLVGTVES